MKKTYSAPVLEQLEAQVCQMLAESIIISEKTVDGGDALSKESAGWDIWNDK